MKYLIVWAVVWVCAAIYLRKRKSSLITSIGGGFILGLLSLAPLAYVVGDAPKENHPPTATNSPQPPLRPTPAKISREKFVERFLGKSGQEVFDALGPPSYRQQSTSGPDLWYYEGITYDPLTNKEDNRVQLVILVTVKDINFY
jgi:hypothetical protein